MRGLPRRSENSFAATSDVSLARHAMRSRASCAPQAERRLVTADTCRAHDRLVASQGPISPACRAVLARSLRHCIHAWSFLAFKQPADPRESTKTRAAGQVHYHYPIPHESRLHRCLGVCPGSMLILFVTLGSISSWLVLSAVAQSCDNPVPLKPDYSAVLSPERSRSHTAFLDLPGFTRSR